MATIRFKNNISPNPVTPGIHIEYCLAKTLHQNINPGLGESFRSGEGGFERDPRLESPLREARGRQYIQAKLDGWRVLFHRRKGICRVINKNGEVRPRSLEVIPLIMKMAEFLEMGGPRGVTFENRKYELVVEAELLGIRHPVGDGSTCPGGHTHHLMLHHYELRDGNHAKLFATDMDTQLATLVNECWDFGIPHVDYLPIVWVENMKDLAMETVWAARGSLPAEPLDPMLVASRAKGLLPIEGVVRKDDCPAYFPRTPGETFCSPSRWVKHKHSTGSVEGLAFFADEICKSSRGPGRSGRPKRSLLWDSTYA